MDNNIFQPVKPRRTTGWQFDGTDIPDDVLLAFAKRGYLIEYWLNVDNDYDGAFCRVTTKGGKHHDYMAGDWIVFWNNTLYVSPLEWDADPTGGGVAPERETRNVGEVTLKEALDMIADAP